MRAQRLQFLDHHEPRLAEHVKLQRQLHLHQHAGCDYVDVHLRESMKSRHYLRYQKLHRVQLVCELLLVLQLQVRAPLLHHINQRPQPTYLLDVDQVYLPDQALQRYRLVPIW